MSWWQMLTSPTAMFPHVPHSVAVILYSSIVIAVLIIVLALMWICTCLASRRKANPDTLDEPVVENPVERSPAQNKNSARNSTLNKDKDGDTLKQLENMPWWDYVAKHPCVNWYDYYRMVEGKGRSRTCGKHCRPCRCRQKKHLEDKMPFYKESNLGLPYHDNNWERIQPSNVDLSAYYQPRRVNQLGFFPRFPLIPRATWTNERMIGHIPSNVGDDCASRSIASLNSSDMQIMQMVAKRRQLQSLRANHGDVFFGQYMRPHSTCSHHVDHYQVSPYELHNRSVAQRHSTGFTAPQEANQPQRNIAIPWATNHPNGDVFVEVPTTNAQQLPAPPEYPPPPVPLSEP